MVTAEWTFESASVRWIPDLVREDLQHHLSLSSLQGTPRVALLVPDLSGHASPVRLDRGRHSLPSLVAPHQAAPWQAPAVRPRPCRAHAANGLSGTPRRLPDFPSDAGRYPQGGAVTDLLQRVLEAPQTADEHLRVPGAQDVPPDRLELAPLRNQLCTKRSSAGPPGSAAGIAGIAVTPAVKKGGAGWALATARTDFRNWFPSVNPILPCTPQPVAGPLLMQTDPDIQPERPAPSLTSARRNPCPAATGDPAGGGLAGLSCPTSRPGPTALLLISLQLRATAQLAQRVPSELIAVRAVSHAVQDRIGHSP